LSWLQIETDFVAQKTPKMSDKRFCFANLRNKQLLIHGAKEEHGIAVSIPYRTPFSLGASRPVLPPGHEATNRFLQIERNRAAHL